MERYDLRSEEPGPTRLIVGGIHGREWKVTMPILRALVEEGPPPSGKMVVVPRLSPIGSKHTSTLKDAFYEIEEGRKMLALISELMPQIYVELHCYRSGAYNALTDPERRKLSGVPPFVELEEGLLIGSTSRQVRSRLGEAMGITLEIPCRSKKNGIVLGVLRIIRDSLSVKEALGFLMLKYPAEIKKAIDLYNDWISSRL
ncbi:MAG: DUF2119 family protein [Thermoproteota archaeon]